MAPRARPRAGGTPVFLDESGRRRRLVVALGALAATFAVAFLLAVSGVIAPPGPRAPVRPTPPAPRVEVRPAAPIR